MKCSKCSTEINQDSKFCGQCGHKIEMGILEIADNLVANTKRIYFMLGFLHGLSKDEHIELKIKEMVEKLKEVGEFKEEMNEILDFWRDEFENEQRKK